MKLKAMVKTTKGKPVNKKLKWTSSNPAYATVTQAGKVKALPATAGTYTVVGVAVQAGAADELVEIAPWQPVSVTVS